MATEEGQHFFITRCRVNYINLSGGFWGLTSLNGEEWRPLDFPPELKQEGVQADFRLVPVTEDFSVFMWGTAVKILDFKILDEA